MEWTQCNQWLNDDIMIQWMILMIEHCLGINYINRMSWMSILHSVDDSYCIQSIWWNGVSNGGILHVVTIWNHNWICLLPTYWSILYQPSILWCDHHVDPIFIWSSPSTHHNMHSRCNPYQSSITHSDGLIIWLDSDYDSYSTSYSISNTTTSCL